MSQASTFWPTAPDVGPGAKATTILTNLQRGNVPTQNISNVRWLFPFFEFQRDCKRSHSDNPGAWMFTRERARVIWIRKICSNG